MSKISLLMNAVDNISPATATATAAQKDLINQLTKTRQEASVVNKTLSKVAAYEKSISAVEKARSANIRYSKQLKAQEDAIKRTRKPTLEQASALAELQQKVTDSGIAVRDKTRVLDRLGSELKAANIDTDNLADAQDRLTKNAARYRTEIKRQSDEYKELNKEKKQGVNYDNAAQKAESGLKVVGATMTAATITAGTHQQSYNSVRAATDWTNTQHSVNDRWGVELASSERGGGISAKQIHIIQAEAATGGNRDLESNQAATENIIKMMKVFKIEDAETAANLYNKYANNLNMGNDGAESMMGLWLKLNKTVAGGKGEDLILDGAEYAGKAQAAGWSPEQTAALMATLVGNNVTVSESGSVIESLIERLAAGENATKDQQSAALSIGLTSDQIADRSRSNSPELLIDLLERLQKLPENMQMNVGDQLFGEGFVPMLALLKNDGIEKYKQALAITDQPQENTAVLDRAFDIKNDGLNEAASVLLQSVSRLGVGLGQPLLDPLESAAKQARDAVNTMAEIAEEHPEITALSVAAAGLTSTFLLLRKAMIAFNALKTIRAGVVNVYGAGGIGGTNNEASASDAMKDAGELGGDVTDSQSKWGKAFRVLKNAGLAAGMYPIVEEYTDALIGDTSAGKWMKETTLSDIFPSIFSDDKPPKTPEIPESTATIPTPEQFDKKAAEVRAIEQTRNVNINFSGKIDGVTPETEALMMEAYKANLQQNTDNNLYDREDY